MPKIYLNSKDVTGVDVVKHGGVCYTRTGVTTPASRVVLTDIQDVKLFYTNCDGCLIGESEIAPGGTTTVSSTAADMQIRFGGSAEGDTGTLILEDENAGTTCSVKLSVNGNSQLVFDTESTGNGPHTFASIPTTIQYVACNTDTYDITLAGMGSYILTLDHTGTGGDIGSGGQDDPLANSVTFEQVLFTDKTVADLTEDEQQEIKTQTQQTIMSEDVDNSIESVVVELKDGSVLLDVIIKYFSDKFQDKKDEIQAFINNTSVDGYVAKLKQAMAQSTALANIITEIEDQLAVPEQVTANEPSTSGGDTTTPSTSGGDTTTPSTSGGDTTPIDTANDRVHLVKGAATTEYTVYRMYAVTVYLRDLYTGKQDSGHSTSYDRQVYINWDTPSDLHQGLPSFSNNSVLYWKDNTPGVTAFGSLKVTDVGVSPITGGAIPDQAWIFNTPVSGELCSYGNQDFSANELEVDWSEIQTKCQT